MEPPANGSESVEVITDIVRPQIVFDDDAPLRKWVVVTVVVTLCLGTMGAVISVIVGNQNPTPIVATMAPISGVAAVIVNDLFRRGRP